VGLGADSRRDGEMRRPVERAPEPPSEDRGDRYGRPRGRDDDFGRPPHREAARPASPASVLPEVDVPEEVPDIDIVEGDEAS
jgi:hypothetical protein